MRFFCFIFLLGISFSAMSYQAGDKVLAKYNDDLFYHASLGKSIDHKYYLAEWENGSKPEWIHEDNVTSSKPITIGQVYDATSMKTYKEARAKLIKSKIRQKWEVKWADGSSPAFYYEDRLVLAKDHGLSNSQIGSTPEGKAALAAKMFSKDRFERRDKIRAENRRKAQQKCPTYPDEFKCTWPRGGYKCIWSGSRCIPADD